MDSRIPARLYPANSDLCSVPNQIRHKSVTRRPGFTPASVDSHRLRNLKFYVLSYVISLEASRKEDFDTPTRTAIGTFVFRIITGFSLSRL